MTDLSFLLDSTSRIKSRFLRIYRDANAGHVGSSLSCLEILAATRLHAMKSGDELVLSKGHAAAALYATLVESGDIPSEALESFYRDGTHMAAHPPPGKLPGILFATGSLGHGLSLSAGLAKSWKLKNQKMLSFSILSDGELNEGSSWEAILFAAHHRLDNLICLVDRNGLQGFGSTESTMALGSLQEKFQAFGWSTFNSDGHSLLDLTQCLDNATSEINRHKGKPSVIICNTIKGRGFPGLEGTVASHYLPMTAEQFTIMNQSS